MERYIDELVNDIRRILTNVHLHESMRLKVDEKKIRLLRDKIMYLQEIISNIESDEQLNNNDKLDNWCSCLSKFQDTFITIFTKWNARNNYTFIY